MDIFTQRGAKPMLIGSSGAAFDDPDYLYELKLDGERFLAYLGGGQTDFVNRRGASRMEKFPELCDVHTQVAGRCILDGELVILRDGKPSFEDIKSRAVLKGAARIGFASKSSPVSFVAFDILYLDGALVVDEPLARRKQLLAGAVRRQNERLSLARYVESQGVALFEQACRHGLEGVVAKRADSRYQMGRRTRDWVKIKNNQSDDFVICGLITTAQHVASLVLGQYTPDGTLAYKGHVTLALSSPEYAQIAAQPRAARHPFSQPPPPGNSGVTWLVPGLVCTVEFLHRTAGGGIRFPVYRGLRTDKVPREAIESI